MDRTLRDDFALQAMVAIISTNPALSPEQLADCAYELADALCDARMRLPMQRHPWPVLFTNTDFAKVDPR